MRDYLKNKLCVPENWDEYDYQTQRYSFEDIEEILQKYKDESLPHESQIEEALDKLMIIRGEHPTKVRHPVYYQERQLAKDLVKHVILSNGSNNL